MGPGRHAVPPDELTDRATSWRRGDLEILGRMPWSSNGTFLVEVCTAGRSMRAIYKPHKGERPLWDFPDGLYRREVAAYELSAGLGWGLIPLTIVREDGPPRGRLAPALRRRRLRAALLHAARGRGAPPDLPSAGGLRLRGQQHRPQGRTLPDRQRRGGSGASTTASRSTPSSSCARSSGSSPATRSTTKRWPTSTASPRTTSRTRWRASSACSSAMPCGPGRGPWCATQSCPPIRAGSATPGPWCSHRARNRRERDEAPATAGASS